MHFKLGEGKYKEDEKDRSKENKTEREREGKRVKCI